MPAIFSDNHICEKCGKKFEWTYFKLKCQNINSPNLKVDSIPSGKTLAHDVHQRKQIRMILRLIVLIIILTITFLLV